MRIELAELKSNAFCSLFELPMLSFQNLQTRCARRRFLIGSSVKVASSSSAVPRTLMQAVWRGNCISAIRRFFAMIMLRRGAGKEEFMWSGNRKIYT